jgi:AcrR family transcriptional regulator
MAAIRRTRLTPEQRRAQLLELGVRMLATRTLEELSIEELAAEAGVSRGLLFHYFSSKQDFHRAVVEEACAHLLEVTEPDPALPPPQRLRSSIEAFTSFTLDHRKSYISLVRGAAAGDAALRSVVESSRSRMAERILRNRELLGLPDSPLLATAVRAWLAFAEEAAVQWPEDDPEAHTRLRDFLMATLPPLIACVEDVAPGP